MSKETKEPDLKLLGQFMAVVVRLYSTIAVVLKEKRVVSLDFFSWLDGTGRGVLVRVMEELAFEYKRFTAPIITPYTQVVDYGRMIDDLIKRFSVGKYRFTDSQLLSAGIGSLEVNFGLCNFGRGVNKSDVVLGMWGECYRPASIKETLAFAENHRVPIIYNPVIGLGDDGLWVECFRDNTSGLISVRFGHLNSPLRGWGSQCRFLAVKIRAEDQPERPVL